MEKRVEKRVAFTQASWLLHVAQNQGQVGHHAQHGEAMSKFPTRPDPNQLAYHAAMVEEAQRDTNSTTFSYDMRDRHAALVEEVRRDTSSSTFSYDLRDRHAALVEEARRDTNSATFSYDLRDREGAVPQETAPRSHWPFRGETILGFRPQPKFRGRKTEGNTRTEQTISGGEAERSGTC